MRKCGDAEMNSIYEWTHVEQALNSIFKDIYDDNWKPDITVGISPSSVVPASILSNRLSTDFESVLIDLESTETIIETNGWLAEMAFGVNYETETGITGARWDPSLKKNILIFLAKNQDSTIRCLKKSWQDSCYPKEITVWDKIWHNNVKFACILEDVQMESVCDYYWKECGAGDLKNTVFPWESSYWTGKKI